MSLIEESILVGSRYAGATVFQWQGRRELSRREPLDPDIGTNGSIKYTIAQGDRLDTIAFTLLGDSRLWWVLVDLNREVLVDTHNLPLGQQIMVPSIGFVERIVG